MSATLSRTWRWPFLMIAAVLAAMGLMALYASPASANHPGPQLNADVAPEFVAGNPSCNSLIPSDFLFAHKTGAPSDGTIPLSFNGLSGSVTIDVYNVTGGQAFSFDFSGDFAAIGVIVKGGPDANFYDYSPSGVTEDEDLHAPVNHSNNRFYGLSHIEFCIVEAGTELQIVKDAVDATVTVGEKAAFDITISDVADGVDAVNAVITDDLPAGFDWEITAQDGTACSIDTSPDPNELTCTFASLADGTSYSVTVQTTVAMTEANCGDTLDNTAFASADNAGEVSDDASISVECAAIRILKNSTKGGAVNSAGAVFSIEGPSPSTDTSSATDNGSGDANPDVGELCVENLASGTYTLNETSPPAGYFGATQSDLTADAVAGTDCSSNPPGEAGTATFTNAPKAEFIIDFNDLSGGDTAAKITCTDLSPTPADGTPDAFDDDVESYSPLAPGTYTCTIVIDP